MTAVLPEPTATTAPASAGRHRAPAEATVGSMGPIPVERRSRSAHGSPDSRRPSTAPLQRAARTGALSLAALGALAGAGGVATHALSDQAPATTGEQALPTHLASADMAIHPAAPAVSAPAVMPVASMAAAKPAAKPAIKTSSPSSRAAGAAAAKNAANRKAAADQQAAASSSGARALALAKSQIGVPYEWGGTTPSGFDCSGLMQWAYKKMGKNLPRTASAQSSEGQKVSTDNLQPGDLVFMYSPVSHVGMYAGNGQILEAPTEGEDVKMTPISHYKSEIVGARRI